TGRPDPGGGGAGAARVAQDQQPLGQRGPPRLHRHPRRPSPLPPRGRRAGGGEDGGRPRDLKAAHHQGWSRSANATPPDVARNSSTTRVASATTLGSTSSR